jgi:hypothetical protein
MVATLLPMTLNHRPGDVGQPLDAKQQDQSGNRNFVHGRKRCCERHEARSGDACRSFGGQHEDEEDQELLAEIEMRVGRLRDEQRSHAEIKRGSIRIEGVSGGHDHADNGFGTAETLEFEHDRGKYSFRGGGSRGDQELLTKISEKLQEAEPSEMADRAEHKRDKECRDDPHLYREFGQREQASDSVLSDRVSHGAQGCEWGEVHDEADHTEHSSEREVQEIDQRCGGGAELSERHPEQNGDQNDLKDIAAEEGFSHTGGNDVQQEGNETEMLRGRGVTGDGSRIKPGRIHIHASAGMQEVGCEETGEQGHG